MTVDKDGRPWRIGTADDAAWIAGHTIDGLTVTNAILAAGNKGDARAAP